MSQPISRLWLLGPPVAILISLLVYYAKFQTVRRWVDDKFPWVEDNIGSRLPPLVEEVRAPSVPRRAAAPSATPAPTIVPTPAPPPVVAAPVAPSFFARDGTVDVQKLAAERSAWPQVVTLKTAKEFPAVVNGKVVGKVVAPVGAEAKLSSIQDGKLGVEYQGGGAWLSVEETDLAQRLRH
jgi:hypothetical protein